MSTPLVPGFSGVDSRQTDMRMVGREVEPPDLRRITRYLAEGIGQGYLADLALFDLCSNCASDSAIRGDNPRVIALWDEAQVCGILSIEPVIIADARSDTESFEMLSSYLHGLPPSLLQCCEPMATPLWQHLQSLGYQAEIERHEIALYLQRQDRVAEPLPLDLSYRVAQRRDLPTLVEAARAAGTGEGNNVSRAADPEILSQLVANRYAEARIIERGSKIVFVCWLGVQRAEGWLVEDVYTLPAYRRQGIARVGLSAVCQEAFAAKAAHVQLSVACTNEPACALYERLGFRRFASARTLVTKSQPGRF